MDLVAGIAALVIATVLLAGAIAKLTRPEGIRVTLIALGMPVRHSWTAAHALIAAETAGALLLLVAPRSPVSFAAVVALFAAFAVAGAAALRTRTPIACACFGSGAKPLGWRQLAQLPIAVAMAFVVARFADWTAQTGLALVAAALLVIGAWWASRVFPLWRSIRATRLTLREARMAQYELELAEESRG